MSPMIKEVDTNQKFKESCIEIFQKILHYPSFFKEENILLQKTQEYIDNYQYSLVMKESLIIGLINVILKDIPGIYDNIYT